jgi:thiamine pyrophosphokinase
MSETNDQQIHKVPPQGSEPQGDQLPIDQLQSDQLQSDQLYSDQPVILVGASPVTIDAALAGLPDDWPLMAADGGAATILNAGRMPRVVIGDLDSLSPDIRAALASDTQIIELLGQDDTDLEKALQRIAAPLIIGLAFLEARFDHSLAALHALMRLGHDRPVMLVGAQDVLVRVKGDFSATLPVGSRFSIWPLGRQKFSQSRGLKWPLDGLDMAAGKVIGTSNQVSDSTVEITASTGDGYAVIMSLRHMPALLNAVT